MTKIIHEAGLAIHNRIDLNSDLGESDDPVIVARDIALMDHISSCNIACGGHAGNAALMQRMVAEAARRGLAIGAHPSYPDRENFGRVSIPMNDQDLADSLIGQITALSGLCEKAGVRMTHVKPHGALYNDAADSPRIARLVAAAVSEAAPGAALCGLAHSAMATSAQEMGVRFWAEAFADRRYRCNHRLLPRTMPGSILSDESERIAQALAIAQHQNVLSNDGNAITIHADTLCLHSDSPGAMESVAAVRRALEEAGFEICSPER